MIHFSSPLRNTSSHVGLICLSVITTRYSVSQISYTSYESSFVFIMKYFVSSGSNVIIIRYRHTLFLLAYLIPGILSAPDFSTRLLTIGPYNTSYNLQKRLADSRTAADLGLITLQPAQSISDESGAKE